MGFVQVVNKNKKEHFKSILFEKISSQTLCYSQIPPSQENGHNRKVFPIITNIIVIIIIIIIVSITKCSNMIGC